ncbi:MAG: 3-isopropylmalate dehydrogenase [Bacteroidia bacterium]|nr:3-isopropylmalate dehydrogenase [Bacteroidia bacterium]
MKKKITVLPGDGIGPEVVNQALKVMKAVNYVYGHQFDCTTELIGACSIDATGSPITQDVITTCSKSDAIILGAVGDLKYDNNPGLAVRPEQGLLELRKSLELYANVRPIVTYELSNTCSPLKPEIIDGVDMVIIRELTGGLYFGKKHLSEDGQRATDLCVYTKDEINRVAKVAFELSMKRRKRLLLIDKANVLETSRLWRTCIEDMSRQYPQVEVDYMFVDNAAMQLMRNPRQFDVILTENMFGDIVSDQCSIITGSMGMLPSASIGKHSALFEPIHGSYPQAANKDIANPFAAILSVAMMYEHFELYEESELIKKSVEWALNEEFVTPDLNSTDHFSCSKVGDLVSLFIQENGEVRLNRDNLMLSGSII